ncbi:MAG: hypothetical protein AMXMBFR44_6790, partial [Candidatus Campbellbacteria bacterium]
VLVADFSKAFDTCNIPILIQKLSQYGVRGALLRVIESMYTGAEARLFVNGVLGKSFRVTNGVAQGCVLSPLFFTIYIDDLLRTFRKSGLGVPLGAFLLNALSFADDLLLISPDQETTLKYTKILEEWCEKNKLSINVTKSGILRSGALAEVAPTRLQINQQPLQYLEEEDAAFKEARQFEYLGTSLPKTGAWDRQVNRQLSSARKAFGANSNFFRRAPVSIRLKIQLAHYLIFSKLAYGAEVMHLSTKLESKIDKFQERVLKGILQVPTYASGDVVRYILGQPSFSTTRRIWRVSNLLRIQHLPLNTRLREIYDSQIWRKRNLLFGGYQQDLREILSFQRCSSVSKEELEEATKKGNTPKSRATLKNVSVQADLSSTAHKLRINHRELLHFCPSIHHPLWQQIPQSVSAHARWLTCTTGAECDDRRNPNRVEAVCRQCNSGNDTRIHRLLECTAPAVVKQRSKLLTTIKRTSEETSLEFEKMPLEEKYAWLLSCGCSINKDPNPVRNNRVLPAESPFLAGKSISPIHGKKDSYTNWRSYSEYREIHSEHFHDLQVYTDGSAPEGLGGYGAVVYAPGGWKPIHAISGEIGRATNNVAELEAIHKVLQWILHNMNKHAALTPRMNIRLFTDSQYARYVLLSTKPLRTHFYLVESIKALAARLRYDNAAPVSIHWVPSHIEWTAYGWRPIHGNRLADKLAEAARIRCTADSTGHQTSVKRCKLQSAISRSLANIEHVFKQTKDSKPNNGPSHDDFDLDASQESPSDSSDT